MNTRPRRYTRIHCYLTVEHIDQVRDLGEKHGVSFLEMIRRLIAHSLTCPFFLPDLSSERKVQPDEPTA